jgi:hypothetical protein
MPSEPKPPAPPDAPKGIGPRAAALWADVVAEWMLDEHELILLDEAVRTVDMLDRLAAIVAADGPVIDGKAGLKAHPALVESRQLRITLARLLAALRLPDGDVGDDQRRQRRVGVRGVYGLRAVQ